VGNISYQKTKSVDDLMLRKRFSAKRRKCCLSEGTGNKIYNYFYVYLPLPYLYLDLYILNAKITMDPISMKIKLKCYEFNYPWI